MLPTPAASPVLIRKNHPRIQLARIEALEPRIVPARMFAVDDANHLLSFDSATPGTITLNINITGLVGGEIISGLDIRPATGQLYALGITDNGASRTGRIYTVNIVTGAASLVGSFSNGLADSSLWGFDFNPVADRLRIVERSSGQSFRVNPDTAAAVTDTSVTGGSIDAVAYDRSEGGTGLTTLYGINFSNDRLVTIGGIDGTPSPNGGVVQSLGLMGVTSGGSINFDIEAITNVARAAFLAGGVRSLYTINLTTGAATLVGSIGNGAIPIQGLTTASAALAVVGTAGNDTLVITATGTTSGSYSLNGGAAVPFTNLAAFSFLGGAGDDTFTINNPAGTIFSTGIRFDGQTHGANGDTLVVQGGAGATFSSVFSIGATDDAGTLVTTNGIVTQIITLSGMESVSDLTVGAGLVVNYNNLVNVISLADGVPANTAVIGDGPNALVDVTFRNKTTATINALDGGDVITVTNTVAPTALTTYTINAGSGTDTVEVLFLPANVTANIQLANGVPDVVVLGSTLATFNTGLGNLNGIFGTINIDDSGGVGSLLIDNSGDANNRNFVQDTLANVPVFGGAGFSINPTFLFGFFNFTPNITSLQLAGGSGADTFDVNAYRTQTEYAFFGNGGSDQLFFDDSAFAGNGSYELDGAVIRGGDTLISYTAIESLNLDTGTGNDLVDATASPFGVTLNTGGGDDTIRGSAFLDTINGGAGGFDTYIATGAVGNVVITDDGITSATFGNDVFTRNGGVPSIEQVIISGDSGANNLNATGFGGIAVISGNGGADIVLGADAKIVGKTATFTDVDGDLVNLKLTKGILSVEMFDFVPSMNGLALRLLDLRDAGFKGSAVTLSAKRSLAGGDGFINLGYLNATGNDLTVVKIDGDLGQIDAGDNTFNKPGIASLIVHSFGELGLNTQNPDNASLTSTVAGLGVFAVKSNFANATLSVMGKLGVAKIAGNLDNGLIAVTGTPAPASNALAVGIKLVTVGGSVSQSSILAGYSDAATAVNADVQIGAVIVRGNWIASNLVAGVRANDTFYGNDNDTLIGAPNTIVAKIAKVLIFGQAFGTFGGVDHYGIVAEAIGSASIGKAKLKFLPAVTENFAFGPTGDFRIREIV